jgi:hypothetical protein
MVAAGGRAGVRGVTTRVGIVWRRATDGWKRAMGARELMCASDDREQVVERLRAALEDGRLKMDWRPCRVSMPDVLR